MMNINEKGSECTKENNTHDNEKVKTFSREYPTVVKNTVLFQLNFHNDDYGFKKTIELVAEVEHLEEQILSVDRLKKNKTKILLRAFRDVRYYAVNPYLDYSEMSWCFIFYVCCFGEFNNFFSKHPEGGFKVVLEIDLVDLDNQKIEFISRQNLIKNDLTQLHLLDDQCVYLDMTLESKLRFLDVEETKILKRCLTIYSRGEHIYACSKKLHLIQCNGVEESLRQFILTYYKLIELCLAKYGFLDSSDGDVIENTVIIFRGTKIFEYFDLPTDNFPSY